MVLLDNTDEILKILDTNLSYFLMKETTNVIWIEFYQNLDEHYIGLCLANGKIIYLNVLYLIFVFFWLFSNILLTPRNLF